MTSDHSERKTGFDRRRLNRRQVAAGGAATAVATAVGATALGTGVLAREAGTSAEPALQGAGAPPQPAQTPGEDFFEPQVRRSENGSLVTTLQAMDIDLAGRPGTGYSMQVPGPTLRFRPGDTVKVSVVNALTELTNFHVHGLHVSPRDNSDNVFVHIWPGQTFNFEYDIPDNHPAGFYWYHPHPHGLSSNQVGAGLAGAIVIEGGLDDLPEFQGLTERVLVLQGPFTGPNRELLYTVNGQVAPVLAIRPGETQRWRIVNASANGFFNLSVTGHQMHLVAYDGYALTETMTSDVHLLGPGERIEALIQGGDAGIYELRSVAWAQDVPSQAQGDFSVATVISGGDAMEPMSIPTTLLPLEDMREDEIAQRRTIAFQENTTGPAFAIDGQSFVEDRVDVTVQLGTTEEWVIRNESPEWHPFHIHVNDFQVITRNGVEQPVTHEDTTMLPPHGEVVMRTRFLDFTGRFVFHCHILGHEDAGMMAVVEVVE